MKRARFRDPAGSIRFGEYRDGVIETDGIEYAADAVDILPPTAPTKVLGVGHNYRSRYDDPSEFPPAPKLWFKGGPNVVAGHGDLVTVPDSGEVVYEVELGVVIGDQCRNVPEESALDVVAGYTCVNDLSDMSRRDEMSMFGAKSFDNAAPMGPVLATPDEVPAEPRGRLWVNGELRQDSGDDSFVFSIPEVVAAASATLTLEPGDVIQMGNPGGFDAVDDGDVIELAVEGIGRLRHEIRTAD